MSLTALCDEVDRTEPEIPCTLARVSRRDIDAGAETLKGAPGVHSVEVDEAKKG